MPVHAAPCCTQQRTPFERIADTHIRPLRRSTCSTCDDAILPKIKYLSAFNGSRSVIRLILASCVQPRLGFRNRQRARKPSGPHSRKQGSVEDACRGLRPQVTAGRRRGIPPRKDGDPQNPDPHRHTSLRSATRWPSSRVPFSTTLADTSVGQQYCGPGAARSREANGGRLLTRSWVTPPSSGTLRVAQSGGSGRLPPSGRPAPAQWAGRPAGQARRPALRDLDHDRKPVISAARSRALDRSE
jgi:hypothetical protein